MSLILIAGDDVDSKVWQTTRELGKLGYRAEVLLVAPKTPPAVVVTGNGTEPPAEGERLERLTYRPIPPCFDQLGAAIESASFSQICIVDQYATLDAAKWTRLQQQNPETVRLAFDLDRAPSLSKQFWLGWLSLLIRFLLRTRKHPFASGVTLFRANQIKHFASELLGSSAAEDVLHLLALTRLQGQAATELITYRRTQPASTFDSRFWPNSHQVRAAIDRTVRFWFTKLVFPVDQAEVAAPRPQKRKSEAVLIGLLMVLAVGLLFGRLGFPLFEPDENRNAQIAMNIQQTGQWATLMLRNEHYWDKPPLQHWILALSHSVFGASPWATRFPIALASMATVLLTFVAGRRLVGFRAAWAGTLCLLMTVGFLLISRYTTMDASLTTTVTAAILFGLLSLRGVGGRSQFNARYAMATSAALGLGVMLKGPLILALCVPPLLVANWLMRPLTPPTGVADSQQPTAGRGRLSVQRRWMCYLLPGLLIALPWFLYVGLWYPEFLWHFVWKHNVVRYVAAFNHQRPFYFYLLGIFVFMFPVSYLFPSLIKFWGTRNQKYLRRRSREFGLLGIAVIWMFLFFSISTSKLATYIVPAFPLICLMLGVLLEQRMLLQAEPSRTFLRQLVRRAPLELPAWTVVLSLTAWIGFDVSPWRVVPATCLAIVLGCYTWYVRDHWAAHRRLRNQWISIATLAGIIGLLAAHVVFPAIASVRSDHQALSQLIRDDANSVEGRDAAVLFIGKDPFAVSMQLERDSVRTFEEDQLEDAAGFLEQQLKVHSQAILVTSRESVEWLVEASASDFAGLRFEKAATGRHVFIVQRETGQQLVGDKPQNREGERLSKKPDEHAVTR